MKRWIGIVSLSLLLPVAFLVFVSRQPNIPQFGGRSLTGSSVYQGLFWKKFDVGPVEVKQEKFNCNCPPGEPKTTFCIDYSIVLRRPDGESELSLCKDGRYEWNGTANWGLAIAEVHKHLEIAQEHHKKLYEELRKDYQRVLDEANTKLRNADKSCTEVVEEYDRPRISGITSNR